MKIQKDIILGISPGSRYIGLAVLRNQEIIDWRLKYFKGVWSKPKLSKMLDALEKYIIEHAVTKVNIKVPSKLSPNVNSLIKSIEFLCQTIHIKKTTICSKEKLKNKQILFYANNRALLTTLKEMRINNKQNLRVQNAVDVAHMK